MDDKRGWKELDIKSKIQYIIAIGLVLASIVLAFISFFMLYEIPNSVLATNGLWLSTALGCIGIGMYFKNSLVEYQAKVNREIDRMSEHYDKKIKEIEEEQ